MNKRRITTENGTVCYWITGNIDLNKDTLFFMHGMTADHTMFERQVAFFENDYNIIVWDAPCHGESRPYGKFTFKKNKKMKKVIYKVKVIVRTTGNSNYNSVTKTTTFKLQVR